MLCPFCAAAETDRFEIEGQRFLVFACMFSPSVDPNLSDTEITDVLVREYGPQGSAYFRGICDRLHGVVTRPPDLAAPDGSASK